MLPDFIIIGAMKCGTTSLHYYLDQHPDISMSTVKEPGYFIPNKKSGYFIAGAQTWPNGQEWYKSLFTSPGRVHGESSTGYTKFPLWNDVPKTIHSAVPTTKLIYVVRDPIDRLVSHYQHEFALANEKRPLDESVTSLNNIYLNTSKYYMQVEQYLPYFDRSKFLILTSDELRFQRPETLKRVFRYLGVDESFTSPAFESELHKSEEKRKLNILDKIVTKTPLWPVLDKIQKRMPQSMRAVYKQTMRPAVGRPELDAATREKLKQLLHDDIAQFRKWAGMEFADWDI